MVHVRYNRDKKLLQDVVDFMYLYQLTSKKLEYKSLMNNIVTLPKYLKFWSTFASANCCLRT